ncbi:MAG: cytochrome c biogenesis protein CcsA [Myxococcota bacterium]
MPLKTPLFLLLGVVALLGVHLAVPVARKHVWKAWAIIGAAMMLLGSWLGLWGTPPEREMGEVYRILYMHVPQVWMGMLCGGTVAVCSVAYLVKKSWTLDALGEASAEVGLLFGSVGVLLGSIWGRPTWGVWWTWDARLTTAAIMLLIFAGYLALRRFVDDPEKRGLLSAVLGIFAGANVILVYVSVRIFRTIHQVQSTPETVDPLMTMALRWNATAFLAVMLTFLWWRYRLARGRLERELALPHALPAAPAVSQAAQPGGTA